MRTRRTPTISTAAVIAALALPAVAAAEGYGPIRSSDGSLASADAPALSRTPLLAARDSERLVAAAPQRLVASASQRLAAVPPKLTDTPSGTDAGAGSATTVATATGPAGSLPRTGSETWLTLLAGIGLLLSGAGLRLRTAAPPR